MRARVCAASGPYCIQWIEAALVFGSFVVELGSAEGGLGFLFVFCEQTVKGSTLCSVSEVKAVLSLEGEPGAGVSAQLQGRLKWCSVRSCYLC